MEVLLAVCCVGAFEASVLWKDDFLPGSAYAAAEGDVVFIAEASGPDGLGAPGGVAAVDVSDPAAPTLLDVTRGGGMMRLSGSLLYVAGSVLTIYNVSDPSSIKAVGRWDNPDNYGVSYIDVVGTTVYLIGLDVHVVDAADPTAPTVICFYTMTQQFYTYYARSLAVTESSVYIGIQWDIGDQHHTAVLVLDAQTCSYAALPATDHLVYSMVVSDGLLYMGTLYSVEIVEAEVEITPVGTYTLPPYEHQNIATNILLSDSLLYVTSGSHATLNTLNVSDPSSPSLVAAYDVSPFRGIALVDTTLFGVRSGTPVLEVIDVSTPEAPKVIGGFGTTHIAGSIYATDTLAVMCYKQDSDFIHIYDVSNPSAPTQLSDLNLDGPNKAFIHGTHVYVATDDSLTIVDITNPSAPFNVSNTPSNGHPFLDVKVEGETAYVAGKDSGLYIYNVSNPSAPKQVGYFNTTGINTTSNPSVAVAGTVAYVGTDHMLLTVDVSSPASPKLLGSLPLGEGFYFYIYDVCVQGTVVYLACNEQFVTVDVSNPTDPTVLGYYKNIGSWFHSVSVVGDIAHVANLYSGLHIFDVSYPTNPVLLDVVELGNHATSVHAVGTTVFVVDYGLRIVGTHTPTATPSATATVSLTHTTTDNVTATVTVLTATDALTPPITSTHTTTDSVTATVTPSRTESVTVTETKEVDEKGSSGVPFWVWVLVSVGVLGVGGVAGVAVVKRRSPKRTRAATLFEDPECEDGAGVTEGLVQGGGSQGFELGPSAPSGVAS